MNGINLSARVSSLKPSATVATSNRAKQMRNEGRDVINFAAGQPDFDTPQRIKDAAIEALQDGQTKYVPTLGDAETRRVIAAKFSDENGIPGVTADHVGVSAGGKHALYVACQCLLDQVDPGTAPPEVIIPVPAWVSYAPIAQLAGGKVVEVPTSGASSFKMSPDQLRSAITPNSRMLVLNSPSNPCGTTYTPDELRALGEVVEEAARTTAPDLVILSDEIYEKIVYAGTEHFSIGSMPGIAERTVTLNGLSKCCAMTGWRVGLFCCPGEFGARFTKAMGTLQGQMTTNITSFVYPAIRVALTACGAEIETMCRAFAERAELIFGRLQRIEGVDCPVPTGAFYVFPDVSAHFNATSPGGRPITTAQEFADALLEEGEVAVVAGEDFGGCGPKHVRLSFACSEDEINTGIDRIERFLGGLSR